MGLGCCLTIVGTDRAVHSCLQTNPRGGRPRLPGRTCLVGIVFVLRSSIPWEMLPQEKVWLFPCLTRRGRVSPALCRQARNLAMSAAENTMLNDSMPQHDGPVC
jgi:transposase